eukprot:COSAG01_NODE_70849_length_257_cov_1.246835_1_plen_27_part_10
MPDTLAVRDMRHFMEWLHFRATGWLRL